MTLPYRYGWLFGALNYDRIVGNGFIRSAENAKHFRISHREIRNDCLAAMRFCSKIAGMHKCIPYAQIGNFHSSNNNLPSSWLWCIAADYH